MKPSYATALAAATLFATAASATAAAPPTVTATIAPTQLSPTSYRYDLTLTDAATSPSTAGTFWFAWLPGHDFMTTSPLTVTNPSGWKDVITGGGATNGFAIQWSATTAASDLPAGGTLGGFSFTSADPPASVFANSAFYPTTPVLTSVAYSGTPFSDAGTTFLPTAAAVPEPTAAAGLAAAAVTMVGRRRRRAA